jgi:N6-adenosine-specific RNA methylase IME4
MNIPFPDKLYKTILADPPWNQPMMGKRNRKKGGATAISLPYSIMSIDEICALPVNDISDIGCHLWLWTTNAFIDAGFDVMKAWGFKYLAPITWRKPTGIGNYFVHVTQTILFGYKEKCRFNGKRYLPTIFDAPCSHIHSKKPDKSYEIVEAVSDSPRIELFARNKRNGWDVWGNEI